MTAAAALNSPAAIRERCRNVAAAVDEGRSRHFRIDRTRLDALAGLVADVTRQRYPTLAIPYHSRWRHFEAGGVDRRAELERALAGRSPEDKLRAAVDLTVVSVLLDAGAGATWSFVERESGQRFARSEGLGVASFRAFMAGAFSDDPDDPLRVDGGGLMGLEAPLLAAMFQSREGNPLLGVERRAELLRRLGLLLGVRGRPSVVIGDLARAAPQASAFAAGDLLRALLARFNPIWLTGQALGDVPLGDVWLHPFAGGEGESAGRVPFHKLTQWLAYSLFEPFEWVGLPIVDRDALTPLPEYRNGGLLLDGGVLALVDPAAAAATHAVGDELVVEWRALTVAMIEELAPRVRAKLGIPNLPLACVLEGGTWAAGRQLAQQLRGGDPPLTIATDGTVF